MQEQRHNYKGCFCCYDDEISIDEDVVFGYLYLPFLRPYFDKSIKYTCRYADPVEFDWHGYNLYTYETVRKMCKEMNSVQQLSKSKLITRINWDYDFSENELLSLINDKGNLSNMRLCFFIKSLQAFTMEELIYLWGLEESKKLYTPRIRKGTAYN